VLDVGCNEGLVTLALALGSGCRSVLGVDIDPGLVSRACANLTRSRTALNQAMYAAVRDRCACARGGGGGGWRDEGVGCCCCCQDTGCKPELLGLMSFSVRLCI
jgi:hypothetical protein